MATSASAQDSQTLEPVTGVERQPLVAQIERLIEAMQYIGAPFAEGELERMRRAMADNDAERATRDIQAILEPHCLVDIHISPESRVLVARGQAPAELMAQGWRAFLVRVHNEAGVTAPLRVESEHAAPIYDRNRANWINEADLSDRWMRVVGYNERPMTANLSGLALEYRVIEILSRDSGKREGHLSFNIGQGTQDIGFRNDVHILFDCAPAVPVTIRVRDENGEPSIGSFIFRDERGRVYPHASKRLAPDFFFHDQVYRFDGESLILPPGKYDVTYGRGPEYIERQTQVVVPNAETFEADFELERWIDPPGRGWFSGDHHIHAAGCSHYRSPTLGVDPKDMMRHIMGEALNVGSVLTWGPGWYHQKQFFTGESHPLSKGQFVLRYDVEVSGFPSGHCGHLCLLDLTEDDFPGTEEKEQWPSWDLPILRWAKSQDAVTGFAHSGWGLDVYPEKKLPNYKIPPMDGIGAQEYLVDVVHGVVDFISTVDTPYIWELNMWYHTLNCGFDTKISGETDFPCIYDERVGLGRSYVKLRGNEPDFSTWIRGVQAGRAYVSDGFSHLMDFTVAGVEVGTGDVALAGPGTVQLGLSAAVLLSESPLESPSRGKDSSASGQPRDGAQHGIAIMDLPYNEKPYWHPERARIPGTRRVAVEVVVNGRPVASKQIDADGSANDLSFEIEIEQSSWVAVRVLGSAHTNAVRVLIGGRPIRASRRSAQWCLDSIDQVWKQKRDRIRKGAERGDAYRAFEQARETYREILAESTDDRTEDEIKREASEEAFFEALL